MNKKIGYSDLALLTQPVEENIEKLIEHGADEIELLMDGIKWDDMDEQIKNIKKLYNEHERQLTFTIHPPAWDINLTSENKAIRQVSFEEYKRAIEFASDLEAKHVVIHPGFCFSPAFDKQIAQKRAKDYIADLCKIAKPLGVELAIENVGYKGTSIFTQQEYTEFLNDLDETATYLIDTGHAHLNHWNIPEMIRTVKTRLHSLHLHDNSANSDEHLPIGEGTLNWKLIFEALSEIEGKCNLILEYAPGTELHKYEEGKALIKQKMNW